MKKWEIAKSNAIYRNRITSKEYGKEMFDLQLSALYNGFCKMLKKYQKCLKFKEEPLCVNPLV